MGLSKTNVKIESKKSRLNCSSPHIKRCESLKRKAILKSQSTVLQKRLLLEVPMMKRVSVISQKPAHILP